MTHFNQDQSRIIYLNGEFVASEQAKISVFDRATLFGDAAYDVIAVLDGKLVDFDNHMIRLKQSLNELSIPFPMGRTQQLVIIRELINKNHLNQGVVYIQVSRGVAERDFNYTSDMIPTIFIFTQSKAIFDNSLANIGISLHSVPDIRWARRDIKSVNLLGQILAKRDAWEAGTCEALMVGSDGFITECASSSFFIFRDNRIITRPLSKEILAGITRKALLALCKTNQINLQEQPFTLEDVYAAQEAFISGTATCVLPVTAVDGKPIGDGCPGPASMAMREIYIRYAKTSAN